MAVKLAALGAWVGPLLLMLLYNEWSFAFTKRGDDSGSADVTAVLVSLALGLVCLRIQLAHKTPTYRVTVALVYVLAMAAALFAGSLHYVCGRFGACI